MTRDENEKLEGLYRQARAKVLPGESVPDTHRRKAATYLEILEMELGNFEEMFAESLGPIERSSGR